jgi:phosphate transport system substrate-binding protein
MLFASCHHKPKEVTDTPTSGKILLACADNFQNLINAEIEAFNAHFPQAFVFPRYVTEKEAIKMLIDDSVRIAVTSRDLNAAECQKLKQNQVIRKYLFAFEGIAIVTNNANIDTVFSVSTLKKILLGKITNWKQINPNSNLDTIMVLFDSQEASVLQYLVDSIVQSTEHLSSHVFATKSIDDLRDKIAAMPNAIGIVGLNQLGNENTKTYREFMAKTRFMWLAKNDTAKPALPYAGDLHNGDYPLWRPIYVLLGEIRNGLPKGFCFFLTQEVGQKVILKSGLMPISDPQNTFIMMSE